MGEPVPLPWITGVAEGCAPGPGGRERDGERVRALPGTSGARQGLELPSVPSLSAGSREMQLAWAGGMPGE